MTTGKTIALIRWTFFDNVMSLLFIMLSRLVIILWIKSKSLTGGGREGSEMGVVGEAQLLF